MIQVTSFSGKRVAVFGLGSSGIATARALAAGGAMVVADDDGPQRIEEARAAGVSVGDLAGADFSDFAALVLSPGIPLTHPEPHWAVLKARRAGVPVIGDMELFAREREVVAPNARVLAITGTNGKSTTTALIAHILREAGLDVQIGGNIGTPVLALKPLANERVYVLECSSYQIDLAPSFRPTIAVQLNISEDHLDRHGTIENYAAVKERLVAAADIAVVGVDDAFSAAMADRREGAGRQVLRISNQSAVPEGVWAVATRVVEPRGRTQVVVADLAKHPILRGSHNAQNAAAAVATSRALGLGLDEVRRGLGSFPGLPHRLEPVGRLGKVLFVNDSKATNADAAGKALASFPRIFWIAGGKAKTGGIGALEPYFPRIAAAYLIGAAAEEFAATLDGKVPYAIAGTLDMAVRAAAADAAEDVGAEPVVLLSPACASFDQFKNFEARGDAFRALVQDVIAAEGG